MFIIYIKLSTRVEDGISLFFVSFFFKNTGGVEHLCMCMVVLCFILTACSLFSLNCLRMLHPP